MLASALYLGNMLGCLILPVLFTKCGAKWVNSLAVIGNAVTVAIIAFTNNYWIVMVSRALVGLFQVSAPYLCSHTFSMRKTLLGSIHRLLPGVDRSDGPSLVQDHLDLLLLHDRPPGRGPRLHLESPYCLGV